MSLSRSRLYKPLLGVLILGLLGSSVFTQRRLNTLRREHGLTRLEPLQNAPPILTLTTVVLGGFRGLIANALWIRALELQDEDKFFEMVQLADWITKLQPHIATVWVVQAWNMSYNISVKFTSAADRWNWVRRAIELLRDEGLHYNPKNTDIYRELAWQFQNKMGHNLDDAHGFYKNLWAHEMQAVLGAGRPDFDALISPKTDDARARAKILRETYKLDPAVMKELDLKYGPLEWRLPEAHALYWASLGKRYATQPGEYIKLQRVVYQAVFSAFHRGRIVQMSERGLELGPNLALADKTDATFEETMAGDPEQRELISRAHKNFLLDAVYYFYVHNQPAEAERWFKKVHDRYPRDYPANMTMEEYAINVRLQEDIGETDQNRITSHLRGLLLQSYSNLARGDDDEAVGYGALARNLWSIYMQKVIKSKSEQRVSLPPLEDLQRGAVRQLLDPEAGLQDSLAAVLRTKIPELAAQVDAEFRARRATNAPPAAVPPPGP